MFANLHSHTCYSILDAINTIPALFKQVFSLGQTTVVLSDHGTMAGMYEAYKEYKKYKAEGKGIKLIPGNEIYFVEDLADKKSKRRHLVLLAANETGYKNLLKITSEGFFNCVNVMGRDFPRVDAAILRKYNEGLFALSACGGSLLGASIFGGEAERAKKAAELFRDIFSGGRFFIELQPHSMRRGNFDQDYLNDQLKIIAEELGIEMVATCDSHYLTPAHEKYHDMILAISSKKALDDPDRHRYASVEPCIACAGSGRVSDTENVCMICMGLGGKNKSCAEFYVKSENEVKEYFTRKYSADVADKLIANTAKIAAACDMPDYMEPSGNHLPTFPWEKENDAEAFKVWLDKQGKTVGSLKPDQAYLRYKSLNAFNDYTKEMDKDKKKEYWKRLVIELETLEKQDFCSYMLIVADYVNWAKNNGVKTGPGRGSCSGSLIAFLIKIHAADPIEYDLLFERFHNKLKSSPPDIDMDFAPSGRLRVIDYIRNKYGKDNVCFVSNVLHITPKIAIKDICRSLNIGGDKSRAFAIANEITADIPDTVKLEDGKIIKIDSMERALKYSEKLRIFAHQYPEVMDYAVNIVGLPRGFSTHAAAIILADKPIYEYAPLRADSDGNVAIQYEKNTCEELGLFKMDILGLETLDVLEETYNLSKQVGVQVPAQEDIPFDDAKTYSLIQSGITLGVFQLADTMTPLCKGLKPNSIFDIALINALGRPSCSAEERADFIDRRFGRKPIVYPHNILEPVLKSSYGVAVFEEDLLRLAQHTAAWDLAEGDGLRKLSKLKDKGAALAEKLEKKFVKDTVKNSQIPTDEAQYIWDNVVASLAKYAFNKSHAIVYSMTSYQTAYYKVHTPGPFLCALLNSETRGNKPDREEAIDAIKKEMKKFKISIKTCDINISKQYYTMSDKSTAVMGLGAIKGLGDKALEAIINYQPYSTYEDFLYRTPSTVVNKTVIIGLAKAGAFDSLAISRKYAVENYEKIRKAMLAHRKKQVKAGAEENMANYVFQDNADRKDEWDMKTILSYEKEVIGEYVSGSADILFPGFFKGGHYSASFSKIANMRDGETYYLEGLVSSVREMTVKKPGKNFGKTMARFVIESLKGENIEMTMWADAYGKTGKYLKPGQPIRALTKVNDFNGVKNLLMINLEAAYKMTGGDKT